MQTLPVEYSVSDAALEELKAEYSGLTISNTAEYEVVRKAIGHCRDLRVATESKRKELKADALEYGRKVDSEAKRITEALLSIEEPLKLEKSKVDDEKARVKKEKEDALQAKMEAELQAKREAEEAAAKAERDRIAAEQKIEADRLAAERAELEAERAAVEAERQKQQAIIDEQNRAQQAKLDAEAAKLKAERDAIEREKFQQEAKIRAEREATEKVEREAAEKKAREEAAKAEAERLAAMAPDREKLAGFALTLRSLKPPMVSSLEAQQAMEEAFEYIADACCALELFAKSGEAVAA